MLQDYILAACKTKGVYSIDTMSSLNNSLGNDLNSLTTLILD